MESIETTAAEWTERIKQLADQFNVEEKTVRLITEVVRLQRAGPNNGKEPQTPTGTNQARRSELKLDGSGLASLIEGSHLEVLAGVLAGIEFAQNKEFAGKIAGMLKSKFDFLNEGLTPGNAAQKHGLDLELDVLPALQWLRFLDGYKTSMLSEADEESVGEPILKPIKKWLSERTYTEKLSAVLISQLLMVESMYEKPDDEIGDNLLDQWQREIIETLSNPGYTQKADPIEMAVSGFLVSLFPVRV